MGWYEELQQQRLDRVEQRCLMYELKCRDLKEQVAGLIKELEGAKDVEKRS
jgi:hypothetical protein